MKLVLGMLDSMVIIRMMERINLKENQMPKGS